MAVVILMAAATFFTLTENAMNKNFLTVLVVLLIAVAVAGGLFLKSQLEHIEGRLFSADVAIAEQAAALDTVKAAIVKLGERIDKDDDD